MRKFDYPINNQLIYRLKKEYRIESLEKGNSWRDNCDIEFLTSKLAEEYFEYKDLFHNHTCGYGNYPKFDLQEELIDIILVASMCYWRLDKE